MKALFLNLAAAACWLFGVVYAVGCFSFDGIFFGVWEMPPNPLCAPWRFGKVDM
jgi:hypothetical protein